MINVNKKLSCINKKICVITGHTSGIGKALYDYFSNLEDFTVIGLASSNGFHLAEQYDDIISIIAGCDLFINNAYYVDYQERFLIEVEGKVPHIITVGSIAGLLINVATKKQEYVHFKHALSSHHTALSYISSSKLLLLNVGLAENSSTEPGCTFNDIVEVCAFWLSSPSFNTVTFNLPLTRLNTELINIEFGSHF